jgi:hypothetical protein
MARQISNSAYKMSKLTKVQMLNERTDEDKAAFRKIMMRAELAALAAANRTRRPETDTNSAAD